VPQAPEKEIPASAVRGDFAGSGCNDLLPGLRPEFRESVQGILILGIRGENLLEKRLGQLPVSLPGIEIASVKVLKSAARGNPTSSSDFSGPGSGYIRLSLRSLSSRSAMASGDSGFMDM